MTTLRQLLLVLAGIFAILVITALSQTAVNFRAACEAAKGNAVWNGRHWECLK